MPSIASVLIRAGPADPAAVERMLAASGHRGRERRTAVLGAVALGTSHGRGPETAELSVQDGLAAAFVGFLDNRDELMDELEARGERADRSSAAAVVAAAFRAFGTDAPRRMRGVFTAVVTDGRTLRAFRDPLGFRPLVYRYDSRGLFVATEAKQVVAGAQIPYEPDPEVVERIFYGRMRECWGCAIRGIERLPEATLLEADADGVRLRRYWDPEPLLESGPRLEPDELRERFDQLMERAVARALVGEDVLALSGGIDSPAVAAYGAPIHRERTGRPLPCLSAVYPKYPSVDESRYITAVAEHFDLPLHTYEPRTRATDRLRDWVRLFDGPFPVLSLNETLETLTRARRLGYRNLLTGEFAEFVGDMRDELVPHLLARGRIRAAARRLSGQRSGRAFVRALGVEAIRAFMPPRLREMHHRLRGRPDGPAHVPEWLDRGKIAPWPVPPRSRWRESQLDPLRGPAVSVEADELVQAVAGVTTRRPWADLELWEFFLGLPAEVKFPDLGRKTLIRRLLRGRAPDVILDRRDKTVFDREIVARIDYPALRGWLSGRGPRVDGVDYERLWTRLEREDLDLVGYMWAKDLAAAHAFLSLWEDGEPQAAVPEVAEWTTG